MVALLMLSRRWIVSIYSVFSLLRAVLNGSESRSRFQDISISSTSRVMKLLRLRTSEIQTRIHARLDAAWTSLVHADITTGSMTIMSEVDVQGRTALPRSASFDSTGGHVTLADAMYGMQAFKEKDERMEQLWRNLDAAIVTPLMKRQQSDMPKLSLKGSTLQLAGKKDDSLDALYSDLEIIMGFLAERLPHELLHSVSAFLVADLAPRLIREWLNPAVPSSLAGIPGFEGLIQRTQIFCQLMGDQGYEGFDELNEWAEKAPTVWLDKCRETALNTVRNRLTKGVGQPKQVEKVEKHVVSVSESKELASKGAAAMNDANDWGAGWGDEWAEDGDEAAGDAPPGAPSAGKKTSKEGHEDDGTDAWGWDDDAAGSDQGSEDAKMTTEPDDEGDSANAWGWGDGDADVVPGADAPQPPVKHRKPRRTQASKETREIVLKETYHISAMPESVLELISAILEDGATLTQGSDEYSHVAATAPGLFTLPTFVLALFRAISPHYYSLDVGGNM